MGNAVYKLLTEQARTSFVVNISYSDPPNLSLIGGPGQNDTPGCRGGNGTRIMKPTSIVTSRPFSINTNYPDRPFLWDPKPCS